MDQQNSSPDPNANPSLPPADGFSSPTPTSPPAAPPGGDNITPPALPSQDQPVLPPDLSYPTSGGDSSLPASLGPSFTPVPIPDSPPQTVNDQPPVGSSVPTVEPVLPSSLPNGGDLSPSEVSSTPPSPSVPTQPLPTWLPTQPASLMDQPGSNDQALVSQPSAGEGNLPPVGPPVPTFVPPSSTQPLPESGLGNPAVSSPVPSSGVPVESAPTDLSQLLEMSNQTQTAESTTAAPPANNSKPEVVVGPGNDKGEGKPPGRFPKWMLAVGGVVILAVASASAYFILGIERGTTQQTSLPAQQPPLVSPPKTVVQPQPPPAAQPATTPSGSPAPATFGQLSGSSPAASPTSAGDLLRQKQGIR